MSNISAYSKAIFAFVALVSIQVSVGLIYKLAASGNDGYQFSRASALAMSELFKLFVSFVLYASQKQKLPETSYFQHVHFIFLSLFSEVPFRIAAGMVSLSVFYLFNNHLAFYLFSQADPGTINLVKSGSTFFTATMLWIALSRKTSKIQWLAITIQLFALISSQYDECKESTSYSPLIYLLILTSTLISALCGCLNDYLSKASAASLNGLNVFMYSSGFVFNFLYYLFLSTTSTSEPHFFQGYAGWGFGVVVCNSLIGLAITAVYKYADAVIKCFAQSTSTSLLLIFSLILFNTPIRFISAAGCVIIFLTTYLYMLDGAAKKPEPEKYLKVDDNEGDSLPLANASSSNSSVTGPQKNTSMVKKMGICAIMLTFFIIIFGAFSISTSTTTKATPIERVQVQLGQERVAVCMVGTTRTFASKTMYESIHRFTESLSSGTPDYFFQIANETCKSHPEIFQPQNLQKAFDQFNNTKHLSWAEPSCDEAYIDKSACCKRTDNPGHWISYMRKVSCYNSVKAYEREHGFEYDWYVFLRPDLYFFEPSQFHVSLLNPNRLYISSKEASTKDSNQPLGDHIYLVSNNLIQHFITSLAHHNDHSCLEGKPPLYPPEVQFEKQILSVPIAHQMLPFFYVIKRCDDWSDCFRLDNEVLHKTLLMAPNNTLVTPKEFCESVILDKQFFQ